MSQIVFSIHWSPKRVDFNTTEVMDFLVRASNKKRASFLLPCSFFRLSAGAVTLNKGISSCLKDMNLPTSNYLFQEKQKKKSLIGVPSILGFN